MEDGSREEETKEEPEKSEEVENLASEHLNGVSLATDTTGLRDELLADDLAKFLAKFADGGSVYRCEACSVFLYFSSAGAFWKHFEDEHLVDELQIKIEAEKYRRAHPNFRVESAPKDRCKACGTWLRCDEAKWTRHLKKAHNGMTLTEYFVRHEFVPVPFEPEEVQGEDMRGRGEREITVNEGEKGTDAWENTVSSTPEPGSNANTEAPTATDGRQDEIDDRKNEGNKTIAVCYPAEMKIEEVRSIDPNDEDELDDIWDVLALHSELVTEQHPILIGPENPDINLLNRPFLNILKQQEIRERYNLCLYECQICLALFDSIIGISAHLNYRHEINFADHAALYGKARVLENYFLCELCRLRKYDGCSQTFCDGDLIQQHLLYSHGLNLLQYDKIVRGEDLWYDSCIYRCRLCPSGSTFAGIRKFETHFAADHAGGNRKTAMATVCKSNYECVICLKSIPGVPGVFDQHVSQKHGLATDDYLKLFIQKLMHPGASVIRVEVPVVEVPKEWYNGCLFKCFICHEFLNGSDHLINHVSDKHGMPYEFYRYVCQP